MQIFWHGLNCIRLETAQGESEAILVTDPYGSESGLRFPRTLAPDIVTLSNQAIKNFPLDQFTNRPFLINDPGEYEIKGIFSYAFPLKKEGQKPPYSLIFRFEAEGMSIGFLGGLDRALTEDELGRLENIDILLVPAGGRNLPIKQTAEMVNQIEPRLVIPLDFQIEGLKEKVGTVDAFCKELGLSKRENVNKLKIARKDLPADETVVMVLERA